MALNIAVPLSGVGGLSPMSPIGIDCWENIKMLVSPIGSESSGVSSLDSEEAKHQLLLQPSPPETPKNYKIEYNGRDILDLAGNIQTNSKFWNLRYTYLPENNNIPMFLANRSQYHRLGANGHIQEYSLVTCDNCDFQYTINGGGGFFCQTSVTVSPTATATMTYTGQMLNQSNQQIQRQQQQQLPPPPRQQQQLQQLQQHHNHSNNNYNLYKNNNSNHISNSFLKKTTATTLTTSSTSSSLSSTSPTSSDYSSSSSIGGGGGSFCGSIGNGGNKYSQFQTPTINNNHTFNNKTVSSSTFNNFCSFLNAFNNNNNSNNGYVNQNQTNNATQPTYTRMYNYF